MGVTGGGEVVETGGNLTVRSKGDGVGGGQGWYGGIKGWEG